ncbi:hypothetical protein V8B97DRAFT_1878677 [Scleroderma yunnanense]
MPSSKPCTKSSLNLMLWYWFCSQNFPNWEFVEIEPDTRVSAFIKLIQSDKLPRNALHQTQLKLFKVPIPVTDNKSGYNTLGELSHGKLRSPLQHTSTLSKYFNTSISQDHLHLIHDDNSCFIPLDYDHESQIACCFQGEQPNNKFLISVYPDLTVDEFKGLIKQRVPTLSDVPDCFIGVYLILDIILKLEDEVNGILNEVLSEKGKGTLLNAGTMIWQALKHLPFNQTPWVVAEQYSSDILSPSKLAITGGNPIKAAWECFLCQNTKEAPSSSAVPSSFHQCQVNSEQHIFCAHPHLSDENIPVALLHLAFGQFLDECQTCKYSSNDYVFTQNFADLLSEFDENEQCHKNAFYNDFYHYYGMKLTNTKIGAFKADGDLCIKEHCYLIVEVKNEIGSTVVEPYLQAVLYYIEASPNINFCGATWNLHLTMEVLSSISCCFYSADILKTETLAHYLAALQRGLQSLKLCYESSSFEEPIPPFLPLPQIFPYPTNHQASDGRIIEFQYQEKPFHIKFVFFRQINTTEVCIKFTRSYLKEAHHYAYGLFKSLRQFHEADFIHGNIHDGERFMILNFDWGGKASEVKYPPSMNKKDIWRLNDVEDLTYIRKEHDLAMLEHLCD